jgi:hypothetical protein
LTGIIQQVAARRQNLPARLLRLSDRSWLELLLASLSSREVAGISLPAFPSSEVQQQFTGSSDRQTLHEAFGFYTLMKESCAALGVSLGSDSRMLDFGVGWGRVLRFFLKDIDSDNLYGCDIDPSVIALCRQLGVPGNLDRTYPAGKLPYPDSHFDAMFSYSVFTHLPEPVHLHWLEELARVARPSCVFALTLEPRGFIDFVAALGGRDSWETPWHAHLAHFADRCPQLYADFDAGRIAYIPTGGGDYRDSSVYGDAIVPLAYIERAWSRYFTVHDYIDDRRRYQQAVLILQRR